MQPRTTLPLAALLALAPVVAQAGDGNRLVHLAENSPYHVSLHSPRLTTPQWIGEEGVEAVVILAIDDMTVAGRYENYLRPILERLEQIDGRTPVSIMTTRVDVSDPLLQQFLEAGLSIEAHTLDHPCPLLRNGDLAAAISTYNRCIDDLALIPGCSPVAFRMPCCDSMNSLSPRFFDLIFNTVTPGGRHLRADSSVFHLFTSEDPSLPRALVLDEDGQERFEKYVPAGRSFVNTIENHPYPYVIDRLCWEFPAAVPSDWEAQHRHGVCNPRTVTDLCAGIDATVARQGVFTLCFHPAGWIRNQQVVEIVHHAATTHGAKVKFLTLREAVERLETVLLDGFPLRREDGQDQGVRLIDVDADGFTDVVIANEEVRRTRRWSPSLGTWMEGDFPIALVERDANLRVRETGGRFGVLRPDGTASLLFRDEAAGALWHYNGVEWVEDPEGLAGLEVESTPVLTSRNGVDGGVRFRDLDRDGICELIASHPEQRGAFRFHWNERVGARWSRLPFALPDDVLMADSKGRDRGLRFVDLDGDHRDDLLFSNEEHYAAYRFVSMEEGWAQSLRKGAAGEPDAVPMIVRGDSDNGAWFHSGSLWVQNEDTAHLPHQVRRMPFTDLVPPVVAAEVDPALESIVLREGFRIETVAAEPLVMDPIAFAWGADRKLWVVEMGDYPLGLDGEGAPGGRVRFLEDPDGDGRYDRSTLFLDGLSYPTGVMPWRNGVLVTCAPEIFFAADTDGDGRADHRETLYSGFGQGNQQHRLNGLRRGLDNWIHVANGDSSGTVHSHVTGEGVPIRGRDLRIRPADGSLDAQTGQTQYGRDRDDEGNWFGGNNSFPFWHYVLPDHYLRRNPFVAAPNPRVDVSVTPGNARVYPVSEIVPRFNTPSQAGHFSSACSPTVYRDRLLGRAFVGNLFVCEPVHNLVHREVRGPRGSTFRSQRAIGEEHSEFLASRDPWFRPVMVRTGPDGALWVADMQRAVIEHPEWIPDDQEQQLDLREGHDKGRIYRVLPIDVQPRPIPDLAAESSSQLLARLGHVNGWQRDNAQHILIERDAKELRGELERMALGDGPVFGRLHALCTLDGLEVLGPDVLLELLRRPREASRNDRPDEGSVGTPAVLLRHAIRLSEPHLAGHPEFVTALRKHLDVEHPQVRLQLAFTLGECEGSGAALARLALDPSGDVYLNAAVLSSLTGERLVGAVRSLVQLGATAGRTDFLRQLIEIATASDQEPALALALHSLADEGSPVDSMRVLAGMLEVLDRRGIDLEEYRDRGGEPLRSAINALSDTFVVAREVVADPSADLSLRQRALRLLAHGFDRREADIASLASLLVPQTPSELQVAAIDCLRQVDRPEVPTILLEGWAAYTPDLRRRVADVLLGRPAWTASLLAALEGGKVRTRDLDAVRRQRLLETLDDDLRARAAQQLGAPSSTDRGELVERFLASTTPLHGEPERGRVVFQEHCATCHQLAGVGKAVGPDLVSLTDRSNESLLTAILDPNRAVEARYLRYNAWTMNGLIYSGLLVRETGNSLTLLDSEGEEHVLLRKNIEALKSSAMSAMPEGLEEDLDAKSLADLLSYVRDHRPPRKVFEGNEPRIVRAEPGTGELILDSAQAEVYGSTLRYVHSAHSVGYWRSLDDHTVWTLEVPRSGAYEVWLNHACADDCSGDCLLVESAAGRLTHEVASTGSWGSYRKVRVGVLHLEAGRQQFGARTAGPLRLFLINLREIRLVPVAGEEESG